MGVALLLNTEYPNIKIDLAESYEEAKFFLSSTQYDLLLLDIDMPGSLYRKMIPDLRTLQKDLKILIFTGYQKDIASIYIKEGANGYISKESFEDEIKNAIQSVIKTGFYYPLELIPLLIQQAEDIDLTKKLSSREYEIFELFARGNGNLEISNILNLQMPTVSTYKKRIFEKLNIRNIVELIYVYENLH